MDTFVRFETPLYCEASHQPTGLFWAVGDVEARADLDQWTREWLDEMSRWFGRNLPVPRFVDIDARAIFWFRPQSKIVREAWSLVAILREEGVPIGLRRTHLPGRIVYHDEFQIAAIPFGRGRRRRRATLTGKVHASGAFLPPVVRA
jgi:hypothetical protein